jgi:hypothetical protein
LRIDVRVRGLNVPGKVDDIDVRIFHPDCTSYVNKTLPVLFKQHVVEKRKKYKEYCDLQGHAFVPFVLTTDGALSDEADAFLSSIAHSLATKWRKSKGVVMAWLRAKVSLTAIRTFSAC